MPEITKTIKDAVKELRALQAELGEDQKELSGINEELTGIEEAKEKNKKKGKTKTPKPVVHKQKSLPPKKEEVFDLDKEIAEAKARIDAGIEKMLKKVQKYWTKK